MDPFDILSTATNIGAPVSLAGVLCWAAHQRAAVHRVWRARLRDRQTNLGAFQFWMAASTGAGLV